jgi:hypothetical protein
MIKEELCMDPSFVYGPECLNCLSHQGFVMCGWPTVTHHVSKAILEALRTNDCESVPQPFSEFSKPLLDVPFECPRCTCKLSLDIATDDEGRIIARILIGGERIGDDTEEWLDLPPRA